MSNLCFRPKPTQRPLLPPPTPPQTQAPTATAPGATFHIPNDPPLLVAGRVSLPFVSVTCITTPSMLSTADKYAYLSTLSGIRAQFRQIGNKPSTPFDPAEWNVFDQWSALSEYFWRQIGDPNPSVRDLRVDELAALMEWSGEFEDQRTANGASSGWEDQDELSDYPINGDLEEAERDTDMTMEAIEEGFFDVIAEEDSSRYSS